MELPLNHNRPTVMHIDLNSCFATVEQQANPLLRGKPLAVAAYDSPNGCIVSPSIEAKRHGIKTGMPVREGRLLCPKLIVRTPDPTSTGTCISSSTGCFGSTRPTSPPSRSPRRCSISRGCPSQP